MWLKEKGRDERAKRFPPPQAREVRQHAKTDAVVFGNCFPPRQSQLFISVSSPKAEQSFSKAHYWLNGSPGLVSKLS